MRNLLRILAIFYGIIFICFGVLGFTPCMTPNDTLFGLFLVNPTLNSVHLFTGLFAVAAGAIGNKAAKIFFQLSGFFYAIITILGFACGEKNFLGILASNMADTWVNLLIAIVSLYFGFYLNRKPKE